MTKIKKIGKATIVNDEYVIKESNNSLLVIFNVGIITCSLLISVVDVICLFLIFKLNTKFSIKKASTLPLDASGTNSL